MRENRLLCFNCCQGILRSDKHLTVWSEKHESIHRFHLSCVFKILEDEIDEYEDITHGEPEEPQKFIAIVSTVQKIADSLGFTAKDTIGDLIEAIQNELSTQNKG